MTLQELERRLKDQVPGSLIPRDVVLGWVRAVEGGRGEDASDGDALLTVEEVAAELGRGTSTVRGWLRDGLLDGAFKLRGREWRIPRRALRSFLASEARHDGGTREVGLPAGRSVDLGAWRKHRGGAS